MTIKAKLFALTVLCLSWFSLQANDDTSLPETGDPIDEFLATNMNDWMNNFPTFTDEEYKQRLLEMSGAIKYKLHPIVRERIEARTERYRASTERLLGISEIYFPIFEEHLAKYNVPHHLKYLPIIESRFQPAARSYAGAVGLWQFIPSTGKLYDLAINSTMDQRSDTHKASEAAAKMLSELYKRYDDWALSLAAYNCGPGRVNRAIKSAGGVKDYWKIRHFLPTETQKYVPYFMAVAYVWEFHYLHELEATPQPQSYVLTDTIQMKGGKSLRKLAEEVDMDFDTLKFLNPAYLKNYIPSGEQQRIIVLPAQVVGKLRGYEAKLKELLSLHSDNPVRAVRRINSNKDLTWLSKAFRCSEKDLRYWNGMDEYYQIKPGELMAIRKFLAPKDVQLTKREMLEGISIASLQVVGFNQRTRAITAPVYINIDTKAEASSHIEALSTGGKMVQGNSHKNGMSAMKRPQPQPIETTHDRSRGRRVRNMGIVTTNGSAGSYLEKVGEKTETAMAPPVKENVPVEENLVKNEEKELEAAVRLRSINNAMDQAEKEFSNRINKQPQSEKSKAAVADLMVTLSGNAIADRKAKEANSAKQSALEQEEAANRQTALNKAADLANTKFDTQQGSGELSIDLQEEKTTANLGKLATDASSNRPKEATNSKEPLTQTSAIETATRKTALANATKQTEEILKTELPAPNLDLNPSVDFVAQLAANETENRQATTEKDKETLLGESATDVENKIITQRVEENSDLENRSRDRKLRGGMTSSNNQKNEIAANNSQDETNTIFQEAPKEILDDKKIEEQAPVNILETIYTYHKIQEGETIWDIREKYPEVSAQELMELNGLRIESQLRPGLIIKIRR